MLRAREPRGAPFPGSRHPARSFQLLCGFCLEEEAINLSGPRVKEDAGGAPQGGFCALAGPLYRTPSMSLRRQQDNLPLPSAASTVIDALWSGGVGERDSVLIYGKTVVLFLGFLR